MIRETGILISNVRSFFSFGSQTYNYEQNTMTYSSFYLYIYIYTAHYFSTNQYLIFETLNLHLF